MSRYMTWDGEQAVGLSELQYLKTLLIQVSLLMLILQPLSPHLI